MQSIMSVIINIMRANLNTKVNPKLLSNLTQKKSRSGSQGKVAVKEISSRYIPMQCIKSVLINVTENELKRKG